jgi:hypothetical protein
MNIPDPGRFTRSIPKAIGINRYGSNFRKMAKYNIAKATRIIRAFFQPPASKNAAIPVARRNSRKDSHIVITRG